jgi:hypothetical protein
VSTVASSALSSQLFAFVTWPFFKIDELLLLLFFSKVMNFSATKNKIISLAP